MRISIQLNHPGKEKPFVMGKGYSTLNGQVIREWNNDDCHYRKFIRNPGEFIVNLQSAPQKGNLLFWGEWEGNSYFTPVNNEKGIPNGIHEPFHSKINRGNKRQNTDPYVFGNCFKYAICSQRGVMLQLEQGSLILFGTTTKHGFELDTVFVVKTHDNTIENYSKTYRESSLELAYSCSKGSCCDIDLNKNKIYQSQTWWDSNDYFSFVPCKPDSSSVYEKVVLKSSFVSNQKVGHPYKHFNDHTPEEIWCKVVDAVLDKGFYLGLRFDEPNTINLNIPIQS